MTKKLEAPYVSFLYKLRTVAWPSAQEWRRSRHCAYNLQQHKPACSVPHVKNKNTSTFAQLVNEEPATPPSQWRTTDMGPLFLLCRWESTTEPQCVTGWSGWPKEVSRACENTKHSCGMWTTHCCQLPGTQCKPSCLGSWQRDKDQRNQFYHTLESSPYGMVAHRHNIIIN